MSYNVKTIPWFEKQIKNLSKKYPSLKNEYYELVEGLKQHPDQGIPIGNSCYKIRLSIASKGRGKSGGARMITYVHVSGQSVYLLSIYDKSEKANITDAELNTLLQSIP